MDMVGGIFIDDNGRRIEITRAYTNVFNVQIYEFRDFDNPGCKPNFKSIKNIQNEKTLKRFRREA